MPRGAARLRRRGDAEQNDDVVTADTLILPRSVVGVGDQKAGLNRLAAVRKYPHIRLRAFCDTTLVAAGASGLGLRARRDVEDGGVVVTVFLDAQAPRDARVRDGGQASPPSAPSRSSTPAAPTRQVSAFASPGTVTRRPPWP